MQGLNIRLRIWRVATGSDDNVGGAVTTESVVYSLVPARMQGTPPEQLLLQQGAQTRRVFRITLAPGDRDIREGDKFDVVRPINYPYYGQMFRIVGVRYSDLAPSDPRHYMILEAIRSVESHVTQ